jgi:hypothetical protein
MTYISISTVCGWTILPHSVSSCSTGFYMICLLRYSCKNIEPGNILKNSLHISTVKTLEISYLKNMFARDLCDCEMGVLGGLDDLC